MINEGMVAVLSNLENAYVKRGYCVVSRNIDVNWLTGIQWHLITVPTLHITHYTLFEHTERVLWAAW